MIDHVSISLHSSTYEPSYIIHLYEKSIQGINAVKCNLTKLTTKRSWYFVKRSAVGRAGSVPPSVVACFSVAYRSGFWAWRYPAGFLLLSWSVFSYLAFLWLNSLSLGLRRSGVCRVFLCWFYAAYDEQQSGDNHVRRRQRSCSISWGGRRVLGRVIHLTGRTKHQY